MSDNVSKFGIHTSNSLFVDSVCTDSAVFVDSFHFKVYTPIQFPFLLQIRIIMFMHFECPTEGLWPPADSEGGIRIILTE